MSEQEQTGGKSTLCKQYKIKEWIITLIRSTDKQFSVEINFVDWTMTNREVKACNMSI